MRSSFNVTTQDIDDEIRAIKALRELGEHPNLVRILRDGPLEVSTYHYIDMELCNLSLKTYIHDERPKFPSSPQSLPSLTGPSFVEKDCPVELKIRNVCTIMSHISSGIEFLHRHGYVHRDMKPENGTSLPYHC